MYNIEIFDVSYSKDRSDNALSKIPLFLQNKGIPIDRRPAHRRNPNINNSSPGRRRSTTNRRSPARHKKRSRR